MKNIGPNVNGKHKQNYFALRNPHKYLGDPNKVIFRSSWEHRFMVWADLHPNIIKWSSEPIGIPYVSPIDKKPHRYFVDFWILVEKDGIKKQYLIEIKPASQVKMPDAKLRGKVNEGSATAAQLKRYNRELRIYLVNMAKFNAAAKYAAGNGMEFQVCTENFLF